jgi:hypothetical protein
MMTRRVVVAMNTPISPLRRTPRSAAFAFYGKEAKASLARIVGDWPRGSLVKPTKITLAKAVDAAG